ncbi:MAG TPA: 4Fe-4S dicluster domain-containing protein [Smithellaceae bacterium]|nr:4Fe-4S dicluster domain-containing protein [Smithellaceae bacterium]
MLKKISINKISELVAALMGKGLLLAPVKENSGYNFAEIKNPSQVDLDFHNTIASPKAAFFPHKEDFIKYETGKPMGAASVIGLNLPPTFLFGARPCDVKSFEIMDIHFNASGIIDPYWKQRREVTTIFGYAFDLEKPAETEEFYQTLGIGAADPEGSDVFMIKKGDDLLLDSVTAKGEKLLAELKNFAEGKVTDKKYYDEYIKKGREYKTRSMCLEPEAITKKLEDLFHNTDFWMGVSSACLSCGICTFVCPTCYCFDICDDTLFGQGTRRRVWDACMFTDFTLEASGHNPRTQVYQRLRQKINHKYSYHVRKYGVISCVGCGRCTKHCPVNIDIYSIIEAAMKA